MASLSPFPPPSDVPREAPGAIPAEPPTDDLPAATLPERPLDPPRPGDLTRGWTVATVFMWVGVVVALAAVWSVSRQLGLATWWLGPPAQPQPFLVSMLPFLAPTMMVAAAANRVRWLPAWGLLAAAVVATVGAIDLADRTSLAVTQLLVAVAGAVFSVASTAGMYRRGTTA